MWKCKVGWHEWLNDATFVIYSNKPSGLSSKEWFWDTKKEYLSAQTRWRALERLVYSDRICIHCYKMEFNASEMYKSYQKKSNIKYEKDVLRTAKAKKARDKFKKYKKLREMGQQ